MDDSTAATETSATATATATATASPEQANAPAAADDEFALRFLMVNGESFRLVIAPLATVRDIKQRVIAEQPKELLEFLKKSPPGGAPPPTKVEEIRILHLGKLLEDAKTLKEYNFSSGPRNVTTVHILCRVPSNTLEDAKDKLNKKSGSCCAVM